MAHVQVQTLLRHNLNAKREAQQPKLSSLGNHSACAHEAFVVHVMQSDLVFPSSRRDPASEKTHPEDRQQGGHRRGIAESCGLAPTKTFSFAGDIALISRTCCCTFSRFVVVFRLIFQPEQSRRTQPWKLRDDDGLSKQRC